MGQNQILVLDLIWALTTEQKFSSMLFCQQLTQGNYIASMFFSFEGLCLSQLIVYKEFWVLTWFEKGSETSLLKLSNQPLVTL